MNYNAVHKKNDIQAIGIGGIKPDYWVDILGKVNPNSLEATSLVIEHLLVKYNGNLKKAITHYKGVTNNKYIVDNTIEMYKEIKGKK